MKTSDAAIQLIKHHEGVRSKPYKCPASLWTVGVGHVLYPEQAKLPISKRNSCALTIEDFRVFSNEEIDEILKKDLQRFERGVLHYCPATTSQRQFDALVSFSFNLGLGTLQRSTLRQKHNRGDFEGAAEEFLKYTKSGGKVLKGLVTRRKDERAVYVS
jgi:GH24 family phage-related lysozyme (muramidase)